LVDGRAVERVRGVVEPRDMPTRRGRLLLEAIYAVHSRVGAVDFVLVTDELERRGHLLEVGTGNLAALINHCPCSLHAEHYARLVALAAEARLGRAAAGAGRGVIPL
jgi:replicative DNA helicase